MKVTVILADYAAESQGKLTIVGGGWTFTGPAVGPIAIAALIEVSWAEANEQHKVVIELQDTDGHPARVGPEAQPIRIEAQLEVGRPPGHPPGTPFIVPMALNLPPLPLAPGTRYVWVVSVDGETEENWRVGFHVRPT
jgi:hypothetical protein